MNKLKFGFALRTSLSASNKSNICPVLMRWYSNSKDDEVESGKSKPQKKVNKKDEKAEEVLNKLNSLLMEMGTSKDTPLNLKLSKPVPKQGKKSHEKIKAENEQEAPKEIESVVKAAKEVAESLGGDTKQTESELMKKFLNPNKEDNTASISSLSEIFSGMKIDRDQPHVEQQSRSQQIQQILRQSRQHREDNEYSVKRFKPRPQIMKRPKELKLDNINLFGSEPLGIFTADPSEYTEGGRNKTWDTLKEREMKLAVTHPPSNYFQELILWTEQGKLWKFPIDNEQGLEQEQKVSFADHIFLEKHLEPWCPSRGPIRHFMELVCVGLSKNPYLTVEAKREHIEWYRNYFEDKKQLLREVGAALNEVEQTKEIESK